MCNQKTDLQKLLFEVKNIEEQHGSWYVILGNGENVGPFDCEARAKEWKRRFMSTRNRLEGD